MVEINVEYNEYAEDIKKEEETIKKIVVACINEEEYLEGKNIEVNIECTDEGHIKEINKEYREIDKVTDVLSFPMFEKEELEANAFDNIILGDIIICIQRVKEQAIEYGHSFEREFMYMVVHGMFHILGYDHEIDEDKKIMREKEEKILSMFNISR